MRILLASSDTMLRALVRRALYRFPHHWTEVEDGFDAFQKAITSSYHLIILDYTLPRMMALEILRRFGALEKYRQPPVMVLTSKEKERQQIEEGHFPKVDVLVRPFVLREFISKIHEILHQMVDVVCLGGGTGLFTLLSGLKTLSGVHLRAIVSMSDDGGSTGRLRHMFGVLPPGDVRRSLVALSMAPDLLNELIQYRFGRGGELKGHNIGNLLLTALSEMRGSMSQAVKVLSEILHIQGEVIPVTETVNTLKGELENGVVLQGEGRIDIPEDRDPRLRIKRVWQEPVAQANPDALEALYNAHYILIGPGDLFTSLIANLIVEGIAEAVTLSRAKKIYICNVMTKPGETTDFKVSDHVREIVNYLKSDRLDYVLVSSTRFSAESYENYLKKNQVPVVQDSSAILRKITRARIISADVGSERELVRHDSLKLAARLREVFEKDKLK